MNLKTIFKRLILLDLSIIILTIVTVFFESKEVADFNMYFENDYSWHTITKTHVNSFINDDSIEYKFNDIDNIPIDMDLHRYI